MTHTEALQLARIIEFAHLPDFKVVDATYLNGMTQQYEVRCEYTGPDKRWQDATGRVHILTHGIVCWVKTPREWGVLKSIIVFGVKES